MSRCRCRRNWPPSVPRSALPRPPPPCLCNTLHRLVGMPSSGRPPLCIRLTLHILYSSCCSRAAGGRVYFVTYVTSAGHVFMLNKLEINVTSGFSVLSNTVSLTRLVERLAVDSEISEIGWGDGTNAASRVNNYGKIASTGSVKSAVDISYAPRYICMALNYSYKLIYICISSICSRLREPFTRVCIGIVLTPSGSVLSRDRFPR